MKINRAGIELVKAWEGLRLDAYPDPATKDDPVKKGEPWTIGFGHTSRAGPPKVVKGMRITEQQASDILLADLVAFEAAVLRHLTRDPNENQFSAMVSFTFNLGEGNFKTSSICRKFNAGDTQGAADSFRLWNKANGKVMPGLINRREAERALFLRPVTAIPAPRPPDVPAPQEAAGAAPVGLWGWFKAWASRLYS